MKKRDANHWEKSGAKFGLCTVGHIQTLNNTGVSNYIYAFAFFTTHLKIKLLN